MTPLPISFTASSDSNYVSLQWDGIQNDSSFASYSIYRSTEKDGEYKAIKEKLTAVNMYDTSVDLGKTYYYCIMTVDKAGNRSELSAPVACKVVDDETIPVINSITPIEGTVLGYKNNEITVVATDNAKVANVKIEYKTDALFSTYTTLKETTNN